jgi:rSAM/selenodomain-associated transferase 2
VIIPTLNEARELAETLEAVANLRGPVEVIIVDGGSSDETVAIAQRQGVRVLRTSPGRGGQLRTGACAARGEVLWFLHADTRPPADAAERIGEALRSPDVVGGNFTVRFGSDAPAARFLGQLYAQVRRFGLFYGDSAIFVRRAAYERVGGFRTFPLFEDVDLVRRLRRWGRLARVPSEVTTSARRFAGRSFPRTFARWAALQVLYWLGVSPDTLGRFYAPVRDSRR